MLLKRRDNYAFFQIMKKLSTFLTFITISGSLLCCPLLQANPDVTESDVDAALSGNICRCGCYVRIKRAILSVGGQGVAFYDAAARADEAGATDAAAGQEVQA